MITEPALFDEEVERPAPDMPLIRSMRMEGLFGQYTYNIRVKASTTPPVILLYGGNGSGKTTILRLLWHLLAAADNLGHRTYIAKTPFRSFSVTLTNGDVITANKKADLVGDFEILVTRKKRIICRVFYPTDESGVIERTTWTRVSERLVFGEEGEEEVAELETDIPDLIPEKDQYIDYLKSIKVDPYFLADDRRIYSDRLLREERRRRRLVASTELRDYEKSNLADELEEALRRTTNWLRQRIISGTAQGSQGADAIYLEVLSRLVGAPHTLNEEPPSFEDVKKRISDLDERTKQFNEFGLVPHVRADRFLQLLDSVQSSRISLIADVLTPYLEGQRARLDSLQPMESLIRTFVETVNGFLVDKQLLFTLHRGLRIRTTNSGNLLGPRQLSSGERQLLLLLCNALLSRSESALFIIDEPEISLNVKWQRKLIPALLACVQSSGVQFILATHSIEIITGHREFLAQLRAKRQA